MFFGKKKKKKEKDSHLACRNNVMQFNIEIERKSLRNNMSIHFFDVKQALKVIKQGK